MIEKHMHGNNRKALDNKQCECADNLLPFIIESEERNTNAKKGKNKQAVDFSNPWSPFRTFAFPMSPR